MRFALLACGHWISAARDNGNIWPGVLLHCSACGEARATSHVTRPVLPADADSLPGITTFETAEGATVIATGPVDDAGRAKLEQMARDFAAEVDADNDA